MDGLEWENPINMDDLGTPISGNHHFMGHLPTLFFWGLENFAVQAPHQKTAGIS